MRAARFERLDRIGRNTYAGIARDQQHADKIRREDRDVAVQAIEKGFVGIAPVVRGFGELGLPASLGRADSTCVSLWHHQLLRGRVLTGARVCLRDNSADADAQKALSATTARSHVFP